MSAAMTERPLVSPSPPRPISPSWLKAGPCVLALMSALAVAAERPTVAVIVPGDTSSGGALVKALNTQLGDLPITLVIERVAEMPTSLPAQVTMADEVRARLRAPWVYWVDASTPSQVFVSLSEPGGARLLARGIEASGDAERAEAVAVILHGLVRAQLHGGHIGIATPDGSLTAEPAPAAARNRPPAWLSLRLAYSVDLFAATALLVHGLDTGLELAVTPQWGVSLGYRFFAAAKVATQGVSVAVQRHPVEVGLRYQAPFGTWRLGGGIFAGLDFLTREAQVTSVSGLVPRDDRGKWVTSGSLLLRADWAPVPSTRVFVALGGEVLGTTITYSAEIAGQAVDVLSTWRVRARFLAGICVDVL